MEGTFTGKFTMKLPGKPYLAVRFQQVSHKMTRRTVPPTRRCRVHARACRRCRHPEARSVPPLHRRLQRHAQGGRGQLHSRRASLGVDVSQHPALHLPRPRHRRDLLLPLVDLSQAPQADARRLHRHRIPEARKSRRRVQRPELRAGTSHRRRPLAARPAIRRAGHPLLAPHRRERRDPQEPAPVQRLDGGGALRPLAGGRQPRIAPLLSRPAAGRLRRMGAGAAHRERPVLAARRLRRHGKLHQRRPAGEEHPPEHQQLHVRQRQSDRGHRRSGRPRVGGARISQARPRGSRIWSSAASGTRTPLSSRR